MIKKFLSISSLLALALAACGSDAEGDAGGGDSAAGVKTIEVMITDLGCEPAMITTAAGPTTFHVTNADAGGVTEFEVLDGDRILGEAENITPGLEGQFTLDLDVGTFETYCPGGSSERGALVVNGSGEIASPAAEAGASVDVSVAAYRTFVEQNAATLVSRTNAFVKAVRGGDIDRAKALFAWAREPYEAIEPVAEAFGDLDPAIDARENDVPDDEWTGFHRIEKALWVDGSLDGMAPIAAELAEDVVKLQDLVITVELDPAQIANGATELLGEVSNSKITGEEDRYSHTDLWDFQANVDGARAAYTALQELIESQDPALAEELSRRFAEVDEALDPYRTGDGFVLYTDLTNEDTRELSRVIDTLAEPLSGVAALVVVA
jgi:iron uptake system component EfeO